MSKTKIETFEDEELIPQCLEIIRSEERISATLIQRRLHTGYSRTRALLAELARRGYIARDHDPKTFEHKILMPLPAGQPPVPNNANRQVAGGKTSLVYEDRAAAMRLEQRQELKTVLTAKFGRFLAQVTTERDATLEAFNLAREMGAQIEMFTGHQKLLPDEFAYLQPALTGTLPAEMGGETKDAPIDFAKACLAIHQKFPEPVTNYAIAQPILEHLLVQLQLLPKPARAGAEGEPPNTGPLLEYLDVVIKAAQKTAALEKLIPVTEWEPFNRKTFITQGRPFFDLYQRALDLDRAASSPDTIKAM